MTATHYCIVNFLVKRDPKITEANRKFSGGMIDDRKGSLSILYDQLRFDPEVNDFVLIQDRSEMFLRRHGFRQISMPKQLPLSKYVPLLCEYYGPIQSVDIHEISNSKLNSLHDRMEELQDAFLMAPGGELVEEVGKKKKKRTIDDGDEEVGEKKKKRED